MKVYVLQNKETKKIVAQFDYNYYPAKLKYTGGRKTGKTIARKIILFDKMKQDRDTWKRACELACEREDDCYVYDNIHRAYEFYQQAKTEGNDE